MKCKSGALVFTGLLLAGCGNEARLGTIESQLGDVNARVGTVESSIGSINSRVGTMENQVGGDQITSLVSVKDASLGGNVALLVIVLLVWKRLSHWKGSLSTVITAIEGGANDIKSEVAKSIANETPFGKLVRKRTSRNSRNLNGRTEA